MSRVSSSHARIVLLLGLLLALPVGAVAASSEEYVAKAQEYISEGDSKAAVIELKNALQRDPGNIQARLLLGGLYLKQHKWAGAEKEYKRAGDLGAKPSQWLIGYARSLLRQNKTERLLEEAKPEDELSVQDNATLLALRGLAHLARKELEQAENGFNDALALEPETTEAQTGQARLLIVQGKLDEARTRLDQVLAKHPTDTEALLLRAELLRKQGEIKKAKGDYDALLKVAENIPQAYVGRALIAISQGRLDDAMADVDALRRLAKDSVTASYLHAVIAFSKKQYDIAGEQLQEVLKVNPAHAKSQMLFGLVSYTKGDFRLAEEYLNRSRVRLPNDPLANKLLAAAKMKLNDAKGAVKILEPLVQRHPEDPQLLALLGSAYMKMGENSKGADLLDRAVALMPDQAKLRTQLAAGRLMSGDTESAIKELESAVDLGQDLIQADALLVLSYLKNRDFEKAQEAAAALQKRMPDSPIPLNLSAMTFMAAGQYDKAAEQFEKVIKLDPDFVAGKMNLAQIKVLQDNPEAAREIYLSVLETHPDNAGAMLGLAGLAHKKGDMKDYESWLEKANERDPANVKTVVLLTQLRLAQNQPLKAAGLINGLSTKQQESPAVLRLRGMIDIQRGEYNSALRSLEKLVSIKPDYIEGWFQLSRAQKGARKLEAARDSLDKAIALDSDLRFPLLWLAKGELALIAADAQAALDAAKQMQVNFPERAQGYDLAAAAYRGLGDGEKELEALRQAVKLDPTAKRANLLANRLADAGQPHKAIDVLREWLEATPDDANTWMMLGMLEQSTGNRQEALDAYLQAQESGLADNPVLLNNLAWLYMSMGEPRAVDYARQAYEAAPQRPEILDTYGWILFQNGEKKTGLSYLQQAIMMAPKNPEIGLHVGEALHAAERDKEAELILKRVVEDHPETEYAEQAKALLAQLRPSR